MIPAEAARPARAKSQTPAAVEGMSKSTAWGQASVSPGARRLAEQAANRAGLTLEEWLDRAIAGLAEEGPPGKGALPKARAEGASARDLQERLRASAGMVERRVKRASAGQSENRPNDPGVGGTSAASVRKAEDAVAPPEGELEPQIEAEGRRNGRAAPPFAPTRPIRAQVAGPAAFDLESAVSQIASRRRALDAQQAHDGVEPTPRRSTDTSFEDGASPRPPSTRYAERREPLLLAPLDAVAQTLREILSGYDPKAVAADLERRIDFVAARIDALADATVRPEVVDAVRLHMQEVHDLLLTASRRSVPIERIESQISRLVDRVEAWSHPQPDLHAVESAGRRIDAALQQSQGAATRIETSLKAIKEKLEFADGERLAILIGDLIARFDAAEIRDRERTPIESLLSKIAEKLDRLPVPDRESDIGALWSIDHEIKSLRATFEASAAPALDRLAENVAQRLEGGLAAPLSGAAISEQFAELNGRLDILMGHLGKAGALERAARDLVEQLQDKDHTSERTDANAKVAERLASFQQEWTEAERRTEALLQSTREVLDRLIDCLPGDESGPPRAGLLDPDEERRDAAARAVSSARLAGLGGFAPRRAAGARRELTAGGVNASPSQEFDDELLLEPGSGAPQHFQVAAERARAIGSRTNPAVSAHIAAARRAAQSAVTETDDTRRPSAAWPRVEQGVQNARRFCTRHKRSLLLAAILALALTAVARMMVAHAPLLQKSGAISATKPATALVLPRSPSGAVGAEGRATAAVDSTPTGSIKRSPADNDNGPGSGRTRSDLLAAIPGDTSPALREAVAAGSPSAQYDLAQRLLDGRGLAQDQKAAALWFRQAASAGFAPAEFRLGALYQRGVGVERDPAAAKRWYSEAARLGNARAAHNLGVMDAEPLGEKADYAEAAKWFRRAAQTGIRDSQFNLGVLYARGVGVDQDLRESWMWFSLAAAQGDAEAARKRDEVAAKMDSDALAVAADQLARFRAIEPDPTANDPAASSVGAAGNPPAGPGAPAKSAAGGQGSGS